MIEGEKLDARMHYDSRLGLSASGNNVVGSYRIRMLSRILESGLGIQLEYNVGEDGYQRRTGDDVG